MTDLNPQRAQMADESMVRNLAAQATCIWPQEIELVRRYGLAGDLRILDAGCGTGDISWRLAELFPRASVLAVDILDHHLALGRELHARFAPRLTFEHRSIFGLELPAATFDLTVCRHVIQSVPQVEDALAELVRVTKPGGRLHLIAEDYDYLHFQKREPNPRDFWYETPPKFGAAYNNDLSIGRHCPTLLIRMGLEDVRVDYVIVDTLRCPREAFAQILTAWRDGFADSVAEVTRFTLAEALGYFDSMIANIREPEGYVVWFVPVVSARVPA